MAQQKYLLLVRVGGRFGDGDGSTRNKHSRSIISIDMAGSGAGAKEAAGDTAAGAEHDAAMSLVPAELLKSMSLSKGSCVRETLHVEIKLVRQPSGEPAALWRAGGVAKDTRLMCSTFRSVWAAG